MRTAKAATDLAKLATEHLATLSASERAARLAAFKKVISEVRGSRSKSTKPARTPANRRSARARG
jgi:hypothetical protein